MFSLSFTLGLHSGKNCKKLFLNGTYDVLAGQQIPFPVDDTEILVQYHITYSSKPTIYTPVIWTKLEYTDSDFVVFPWNIYLVFLLFILCFALVGVAIIKVRTKKRRGISLLRWTKLFVKKFFTFTLAHLGQLWSESPMRLLQFVILLSVTSLLWIYGAGFSTKSLSIKYPSAFDTYKSLNSPNQTNLYIDRKLALFFQIVNFSKSSVENDMQQALLSNNHSNYFDCKTIFTMAKEGKLAYINNENEKESSFCQQFNLCMRMISMTKGMEVDEYKAYSLMRKYDPEASETKLQYPISKSIRGKPEESRFYSKMRLLTENGLIYGIYKLNQKYTLLVARDLARLLGRRKFSFTEFYCFVDFSPPDIQSVDEFRLTDMKKFLLLISFLLMIAFFSFALEILHLKKKIRKVTFRA